MNKLFKQRKVKHRANLRALSRKAEGIASGDSMGSELDTAAPINNEKAPDVSHSRTVDSLYRNNVGDENVFKQLLKQSIRGRDTSGEGAWDDIDDDLLRGASQISQKLDQQTQQLLAARQTSEHDKLLDQGRVKKVRNKTDVDADIINAVKLDNPFQVVQNIRNKKPKY